MGFEVVAVSFEESSVWVEGFDFDLVDFRYFLKGFADFDVCDIKGLVDSLAGDVEFSCDVCFLDPLLFRSHIIFCLAVKYPKLNVTFTSSCKAQIPYIVSTNLAKFKTLPK